MQRYFIDQLIQVGQSLTLDDSISHHLLRVLRAKEGQEVYLVDPSHSLFLATLVGGLQSGAEVLVKAQVDQDVELPLEVTIACGLSKNDKLEWIIQKGTETGAFAFHPIALDRDVMVWKGDKAASKVSRLQKIAQEAAEQAHRVQVPQVTYYKSLKAWLEENHDWDIKLIAYEESAKAGEASTFKAALQTAKPGDRIVIVFGSEGGLTPSEVDQLRSAGFKPVGLGPRILRAETAPIYALSAISYQTELF